MFEINVTQQNKLTAASIILDLEESGFKYKRMRSSMRNESAVKEERERQIQNEAEVVMLKKREREIWSKQSTSFRSEKACLSLRKSLGVVLLWRLSAS